MMIKFKRKKGHRSGLETAFDTVLKLKGITLDYETDMLPYVTAPQKKKYIPDWTIRSGWYIETKGRLTSQDRKKLLYVKAQHPEVRLLVVFQRPQNKIYKGSPTSYGDWATKEKIEWCAFEDLAKILKFIKAAKKGKRK